MSSKCPVCKYAKCRWIELKPNPMELSTEELERVVNHNISVIEMTYRDNNGSNGSAYAEERAYGRLAPYTDEIERRKCLDVASIKAMIGGVVRKQRWFPRLAKRSEIKVCPKCGHVRVK